MLNVIAKTLNNLQTFDEEGYTKISAFQVLAASKIAQDSIEMLRPLLEKELKVSNETEKIILGNIYQDHHGMGKEIIKTILLANGYQVIDLGLSVPASKFVETAINENAKWIFVSAMMFNTALGMKNIKKELKKRNIKDIKIICGGAPFNFHYGLYKKVKVDYMSNDLNEILAILKNKHYKRKERRGIFRFFRRD
ncbi:MAG: cobalamin B12-binding domain-containing protein [Candidatus Helarchaeota archaeon]